MISDEDERIEQKLQQFADLIAEVIWNDYQNGDLKYPTKKTNVIPDKVDPLVTESFNYGSR